MPSVDQVMAEERAAAFGRRSIKTSAKLDGLKLVVSIMDLTTLEASNYIKLRDRYQLFINGRFVAPRFGDYFDSIKPATEEKLAEIGSANEKDINLAVKARGALTRSSGRKCRVASGENIFFALRA
jgi:hypothetical protein